MQTKKKICAGCNQESYIYKNIDGEKYCKTCTYKLQPPKRINPVSEKQKFKITLKKELLEEDKKFYLKVWNDRFVWAEREDGLISYKKTPRCECCEKVLGSEPNMMFFHHILEKRNYPVFRHSEWNIAILCTDCHNRYETNPDNVPYLKMRRANLINHVENSF